MCIRDSYKKECWEAGKQYFSVASGGGTGRTLHPDNMAAGPASYGMTDTMGRMHSDAQFERSLCYVRMKNYFFIASSTATATATVMPTIGLLPAPRKPIISTCAGTEELPANCASECMRPMVSVMP